jgi:CMP-N-acetylneuraminic acid synthetase
MQIIILTKMYYFLINNFLKYIYDKNFKQFSKRPMYYYHFAINLESLYQDHLFR